MLSLSASSTIACITEISSFAPSQPMRSSNKEAGFKDADEYWVNEKTDPMLQKLRTWAFTYVMAHFQKRTVLIGGNLDLNAPILGDFIGFSRRLGKKALASRERECNVHNA
jgi:hypothetical protein